MKLMEPARKDDPTKQERTEKFTNHLAENSAVTLVNLLFSVKEHINVSDLGRSNSRSGNWSRGGARGSRGGRGGNWTWRN